MKTTTAAHITIILIFLLTLILTATIAIRLGPLGSDYNAHRRIAERYAHGEFALTDQQILSENKTPYPPLFHLLLAGAIITHTISPLELLLQLLIYPLILFAPTYLMYRTKGPLPAAIVLVLIWGSLALFDRGQLAPQSFDMILFPLVIFAFLTNKTTLMTILLVAMVYTHGAYSLLLFFGLFAYSIYKKKHVRHLTIALILCTPMILITLVYLPNALSTSIGINDPQEGLLRADPLYFFTYLSIPITIFFLVSLLIPEESLKDDMKSILLFWTASLIPLLILFPDRFASYAAVPLALFIGNAYYHRQKELTPYTLTIFIVLFILAFITCYLFWFRSAIGTSQFLFQT